jgi:hypothetical protein
MATVVLAVALIVCVALLVRAYCQIYWLEGWKDEVYVLSGYKGTKVALDDFHCGKLRLFELDGPHDMPEFTGRRDGDFEIWNPQFLWTSQADRYATEQFVGFYNRKMQYMHKHPEEFQAKTEGEANKSVGPTSTH